MNDSVKNVLESEKQSKQTSHRMLANYMLSNLVSLPFETSLDVADKLGISESTVGRFCRAVGYKNFKELKNALKDDLSDSPWLLGDRLKDFQQSALHNETPYAKSLQLEMNSLMHVYEYTQKPEWKEVSQRLAMVPNLFIAGFQGERGLALYMVHLLQYLRDSVHYVDNTSGNYSDVLLSAEPKKTALLVIEAKRYSKHALILCKNAQKRGIPVTLITDTFCDWGEKYSDELFQVQTNFNLFWESTASMLSLIHLLVNETLTYLNIDKVEHRLENIAQLHREFVGYTSAN